MATHGKRAHDNCENRFAKSCVSFMTLIYVMNVCMSRGDQSQVPLVLWQCLALSETCCATDR